MVGSTEFVPIALYSQREEVVQYVSDWSVEDILSWLCSFGSIREGMHGIYIFTSVTGIYSFFYFDENDKLIIPTSGWYYS